MAIRQEGNTYYGLSTDTKPTGAVLNGREFKEMDTGKKYLFDAENGEWLEQPEEGGGGGGGGGSSTLGVRKLYDESTDKTILGETWQTIYDAIREGVFVYIWDTFEDDVEFDKIAYQGQVLSVFHSSSEGYKIETNDGLTGPVGYVASSPNDYPAWL